MGPVVKSYSDLILLLSHDPLLLEPPSAARGDAASGNSGLDNALIVPLGGYAAIKLSPRRNGDIHVRVVKHGRNEDLFPADFIVERGGHIRVQQYRLSKRLSIERANVGNKYDLEVHVDARHIELLRTVDWSAQTLSGRSSATTLLPEDEVDGKDSYQELRTGIFVKSDGGEVREYTNDSVELKIIDFDVVDENADGIFEPGDFIRIHNITVQNSAAVSSPVIPLVILPSTWIEPVGEGLKIADIPPNSTITLEGSLRGIIRQDIRRESSTNLLITDVVTLIAKLPDLGMDMKPVMAEKTITIQYPLQIELLTTTKWLNPCTTAHISWKITNTSQKAVIRQFATKLTIRDPNNSLNFPNSPKSSRSIDQYTTLRPNSSIIVTKTLETIDIQGCSTPSFRLDLFLAEPQSDPTYFSTQPSLMTSLRSLSTIDNTLIVAKPLHFTNANILLIPNSETPSSIISEWKEVAWGLGMTLDIYNLGLYQTLYPRRRSVMSLYTGKTIVMMGNEFGRGDFEKTSVLELIDVRELAKLLGEGTNVLICDVEMDRQEDVHGWMARVIHSGSDATEKEIMLDSADGVVRGFSENSRRGVSMIVPVKNASWEKQSEKMLRVLTKQFPTRRFAVSRKGQHEMCIRESLDRNVRLSVTLTDTITTNPGMNHYAAINILSFRSRLRLLWSSFSRNNVNPSLTELLTLSVTHDILTDTTSSVLKAFLSFQSRCSFGSVSIVFVVLILSAISTGKLRSRASKDAIQKFLQGHYDTELLDALQLQLRKVRRLTLRDIQLKIAAICAMEISTMEELILNSVEIGSEVRQDREPSLVDPGMIQFESMFADCMDELLESIPASLTRNSSATLLPDDRSSHSSLSLGKLNLHLGELNLDS